MLARTDAPTHTPEAQNNPPSFAGVESDQLLLGQRVRAAGRIVLATHRCAGCVTRPLQDRGSPVTNSNSADAGPEFLHDATQ